MQLVMDSTLLCLENCRASTRELLSILLTLIETQISWQKLRYTMSTRRGV